VTSSGGGVSTESAGPREEEDGGSSGPDAGAPFPADTRPDTADASADSRVTVTEIRTGRQDGFDRVVLEVGGTGVPGWDVRYVDQPASQGNGEALQVTGEAVLRRCRPFAVDHGTVVARHGVSSRAAGNKPMINSGEDERISRGRR
jgi:hypothetical protein